MQEELQIKINEYGKTIDKYAMSRDYKALSSLLEEMTSFAEMNPEAKGDAGFNYYIGTGYSTYSDYLVRSGTDQNDDQIISLRSTAMFYLRKGYELYDPAIHLDSRAKLRVLTNYANALDTVGRVIEALRIYREILEINNQFSIAMGNYGRALSFLANMVNDSGHYNDLHCYAYQAINKSLEIPDFDMHEQAVGAFQKIVDEYRGLPGVKIASEPVVYKEYSIDEGEEKEYRNWCLINHLFLNPLNEVIKIEAAFAHDPLTITSYTEFVNAGDVDAESSEEPPRWFAMVNQLKEEYAYARYLCFEGSEKYGDVHYADKEVKLSFASYDYCNYSIRIEQIKAAFRILYSLLDQICFFVNDFWKLGIKERQADAFHVYKSEKYPHDNLALNSLYWVLREFQEVYGDAEEPSEKHLAKLRNALEHKFVKVHEYKWDGKLQVEEDGFYHVSEEDLKKYTLRLLSIIREALMYLVYAIGIDDSKKDKTGMVVPLSVSDYPDEWKR